MERNAKRYPDFLDSLKADLDRHHAEMDSILRAMIEECREALGESAEDWNGEPRREIRDGLNREDA